MDNTPETEGLARSLLYERLASMDTCFHEMRTHARQLERSRDEQCRLLGISAERECGLRGELDRERDKLKHLDAALKAHDEERFMEVEDAKRALGAISFEGLRMASMRVKNERDSLQEQLDAAIMRVKDLVHENENLYRRLESVHEVYRLSGVFRELRAENDKLKAQQP